MSVIVAVRKENQYALVADTLFEQNGMRLNSHHKVNHRKVYSVGDTFVGLVGPSLNHNIFENLLARHRKLFSLKTRTTIFETLLKLHPVLVERYYIIRSSDEEETAESSQLDLLIVNPGGIFEVERHREINEFDRFWAIGSGKQFALGALAAAYDGGGSALEIARLAVQVACRFDLACEGPTVELVSDFENAAAETKVEPENG